MQVVEPSLTAHRLQTNWEVRLSSSRGVPYFYNTDTRESMWEAPPDLTQEQIAALPGSKEYLPGAHGDAGGVRPAQVRASHLLVKHNGSRRPSSWKEVRRSLPTHPPAHSPSLL